MTFAVDTVWPADTLEFCPTDGFQDLFVCGTYKLDDRSPDPQPVADEEETQLKPQKRRGQVLLFKTREDAAGSTSGEQFQVIDRPAVPDTKWKRSGSIPTLAVADSEGSISIYEWQKASLVEIQNIRCASPETLCLSLEWSNWRLGGTSTDSIVSSLSNGELCLLAPGGNSGSGFEIQEKWHAHDHEPWVATWNQWDNSTILSGGDDLKLKIWDIRVGFDQPIVVNKRFDAGVTSIQTNPHIEHLVAVGNYDNAMQLFDLRKPLVPLCRVDVGGGAWRVKWHPEPNRKQDLLVACMHDGFKVVRFQSEGQTEGAENLHSLEVVRRFDEHESLAYGVDWSHQTKMGGETLVGACSFYDHKMTLWTA